MRRMKYNKHLIHIIRPKDDKLKKNIGMSRNILIEATKEYEWAVRIDDDSILDRRYLENLWHVQEINPDDRIGAVGGIVPTYAAPEMYKYPPDIFNEIKPTPVPERYLQLTKKFKGDIYGFKKDEEYYNVGEPIDDGAFLYSPQPKHIIPSHHIRSSYLFNLEALREIGGFPSSDDTGFREETIASIKLIDKGYNLYTNTQAVAWHLWAPNLGRGYNQQYTPEDHEKKILRNEIMFQRNYRKLLRKLFK